MFGRNRKRRLAIDQREVMKAAKPYFHALKGSKAFGAGMSPVRCPLVLGTPEQIAWMIGWMAGFDRRFFDGI